jgi:hypothetical protein
MKTHQPLWPSTLTRLAVAFAAILNSSCDSSAPSSLESANEKANSGRAHELTLDEADALRVSRESRQAEYKKMIDRQVETNLAQFPREEVEAYWKMRRAMDAYAESHEDFPLEKQDAMFSIFSQELNKPVNELKALYMKLDAETVLSSDRAEDSKKVVKSEKIDVAIDFQAIKNTRGDIRISGKTNLPESTKLLMSIQLVEKLGSIDSLRQGVLSVTNGNFQSVWCQNLENGKYRIKLMLKTSGAQPESVNEILGLDGENLMGQYAIHPEYLRDGIKIVEKHAFFTLGENPTPEAPNPTFDPSNTQ